MEEVGGVGAAVFDLHATVGKADFLANLGIDVPSCRYKVGRDELRADITFAQSFLIHVQKMACGATSVNGKH